MTTHAGAEIISDYSNTNNTNPGYGTEGGAEAVIMTSPKSPPSIMVEETLIKDNADTISISSDISSCSTNLHHRRISFRTDNDTARDYMENPENEIEARKMYNNHLFGFRKWKSHVTSRPISTRSEIVQALYTDVNKYKPVEVSTLRISNILYTMLIGWWLALIYIIIGCWMYLSFIGRRYAFLCFKLADYFFWPFGKFVYKLHQVPLDNVAYFRSSTSNCSAIDSMTNSSEYPKKNYTCPDAVIYNGETRPLLNEGSETDLTKVNSPRSLNSTCWIRTQAFFWIVFAVPILLILHFIVFAISWYFIFTIPIAKINSKTMRTILFLDPDDIRIGDSSLTSPDGRHSEIIMFTHQSFNLYYYKYTVDGVNVIFANLLIFVLVAIVIGYVDKDHVVFSPIVKCIVSILAILPITYYIGMAITSISAQSSFAVGAFLNATFGSIVEVTLFIIMLKKGKDTNQTCFEELVKSTLTGSIMCCILLVPCKRIHFRRTRPKLPGRAVNQEKIDKQGLSMVVGGLKYRHQQFNPRSANISSSLLFVAVTGVFAPTIFSKIYGNLECDRCEPHNQGGHGASHNATGFLCSACKTVMMGPNNDASLYNTHVKPLVYACALILPFAYIIGLIFSMKTHNAHIFEEFENKQKAEGKSSGHHGIAHWSRLKSTIILLISVTAIALCADLIANNIAPLLNKSNVSEYFVGVTLLSIVSMLPEIVNGVQFALQNNVNLSIEIGSAAAIQVCMVQLPIVILADIIYPMGFMAVFNSIHLWAIVFSVIIINYIFQDGKSDYFQGSIIVFIYVLLMLMYFFTLTPPEAICKNN